MPPVDQSAAAAEDPPEFDTANLTNDEDNGGTRQAGTGDEPKDVRSLLANAMKRDPSGKFTGKAGEGEEEPPAAAPAAPEPGTAAAPASPSPAAPAQPPVPLSAEEQAALSSLPEANREAVQALLVARGTALAQSAGYVQQLSEQVRGYAGIEQIIGPRRDAWAMTGVAPEQALNQLLALSDFAGRDPNEFVRWFAGQHGLDLYELSQNYTPPDPQFAALQRELAELKGQMGNQTAQQQQQMHTAVMGEIAQFAQEAGADGQPLRPHFNTVAEDMLHLMPGILSQNGGMSRRDALQVAYDRAVWANPTTRQMMQNAASAAKTAEQAAAAAKARNASKSVTGSAPAGEPPSSVAAASKTVRGALEAAMAIHS